MPGGSAVLPRVTGLQAISFRLPGSWPGPAGPAHAPGQTAGWIWHAGRPGLHTIPPVPYPAVGTALSPVTIFPATESRQGLFAALAATSHEARSRAPESHRSGRFRGSSGPQRGAICAPGYRSTDQSGPAPRRLATGRQVRREAWFACGRLFQSDSSHANCLPPAERMPAAVRSLVCDRVCDLLDPLDISDRLMLQTIKQTWFFNVR